MIKFLISAVMMSLAWSLRGQFGHLKGAMIPGAAAAAAIALLSVSEKWRAPLGLALILSPLGFSAGGHMSYGRLIETLLANPSLSSSLPELFHIFAIGAVWGGLGLSFLGFALAENSFRRQDGFLLSILFLIGWVVLGIFNREESDLPLFAAGLFAIHLYNGLVKKSGVLFLFGVAGILGFGGGFLLAVLILYAGNHGAFGTGWPWWSLRDQILGFAGGLALWQACRRAEALHLEPAYSPRSARGPRAGLLFYTILIPALSTFNVLRHWWGAGDFAIFRLIHAAMAVLAVIFFSLVALVFVRLSEDCFLEPHRKKVLLFSTLFWIWYLSLAAIAKETVPRGFSHWEAAYLFFLLDSIFLTLVLPFYVF